MANISVLGLGAMGSRMALTLLRGGHSVTIWNRTPARASNLLTMGAVWAASPRVAARSADFVIAMVRDDESSAAVWLDDQDGALAAMVPTAVAIDSSTLSHSWVRQLGDRFSAAGRDFVEAPVVGSRPQADAGQLIFIVGGEPTVLARAEAVLSVMGGTIHHAGPVGAGARTKLAVNALLALQVVAMAEIIAGLTATGADVDHVVEILTSTPACSPAAKVAAASMLTGAFEPMFPIDLVEKDLGYALASAVSVPGGLPLTQAARQLFDDAKDKGFGAQHLTAVIQRYGGGDND